MRMRWLLFFALGSTSVLACSKHASQPSTPAPAIAPQAPPPSGTAHVRGHVRFHGAPPVDVPRPSKLAFPECSSFGPPDSTLKLGADSAVAEAFVWIESGLPDAGWPAPAKPVVLDQERCEFKPRVFGVQVNQPVEIHNSDSILHNTHAFTGGFNVPLPIKGSQATKTFPHESVPAVIGCDVHGWMRAYAGVVTNPFYAVTDASGAFDISGLPAGHYTLGVWQERLGRRGKQVEVAEGADVTADVEIK